MNGILNIIDIEYKQNLIKLEYILNSRNGKVLLFLHGLGADKNSFSKIFEDKRFQDFTMIGLDFPGHGMSKYYENMNIDDLVEITKLFVDKIHLQEITIVGHSMGGLVGLLFCNKYPNLVNGFVNIEGNLDKTDCRFSGHIARMTIQEFDKEFGSKHRGMRDVSKSMVEYSNNENVYPSFLQLNIPKIFIYGDKSTITYLNNLQANGMKMFKISDSGHFPFVDNPKEFNELLFDYLNGYIS
ncbi:MAG: alpha/beta hydrolase [Candidatus Absconditabacteria bacterium]